MRYLNILILALLTAVLGCARSGPHPYQSISIQSRNPERAIQLARQAAALIETDPIKAEQLLRESLSLDLYCGPAHNNLGVILLNRNDLYQAAAEFEWARKLMPGQDDPRVNLAITLERAGFVDDAINELISARETSKHSLEIAQPLAWMQLRYDKTNQDTPEMLRLIAIRSIDAQWQAWARDEISRLSTSFPDQRPRTGPLD